MKDVYGLRKRRNAQTLVFFLLAWGTIMLLCGLAIDSGLLYLAKARMGRAVDGAALAAVGNFNRNSGSPALNRDAVATIMRNFAVANFTDLSPIGTSGGPSEEPRAPTRCPTGHRASATPTALTTARRTPTVPSAALSMSRLILAPAAPLPGPPATRDARCRPISSGTPRMRSTVGRM